MKAHECDADCAGTIVNDACAVCGVWHGVECDHCGQRGYHATTCPEVADESCTSPTTAEMRAAAYRAYVAACAAESARRVPVVDLDADLRYLDGGETRRIPVETLDEVAASYYAARAVMA